MLWPFALLLAAQFPPPPTTVYADCESMHAAKIAEELAGPRGVPSCTDAVIPTGHSLVSAGAQLPAPARSVCAKLTPNACARHFRAHPRLGLKPGSGAYQAYPFGEADDLRLADGTRPLLYYKPGAGQHADDWVFFLGGGAGLCAQKIVQRDATTGAGMSSLTDAAVECYSQLDYGNDDIEATVGKGFNMPDRLSFSGQGILGDRPDNAFRDYNVVVLARTNDYFIGDLTRTDVVVATRQLELKLQKLRVASFPLDGNRIVAAAIAFFETAPADSGRDINSARRVLFATSSSGTNSVHRMDAWRDLLRDVTTRASGDAEPAYVALMASSSGVTPDAVGFEELDDDAPCGSVFSGSCGSGFDDPPRGLVSAWRTDVGARPIGFDEKVFEPYVPTYWDGGVVPAADGGVPDHGVAPGGEALPIASVWATPDGLLDESCVATEAMRWKCRSTLYVMFNHLETPLFIAHSLHDSSNIKGEPKGVTTRDSAGNLPRWRDTSWVGSSAEPMAIFARFMFGSWARDRDDVGGGASGESRDSGPIGLWAPTCSGHEPEKSDEHFLRVRMGGLNLSDAASRWFEGGQAGPDVVRLDTDGSLTVDGTSAGCD